MTPPQAGDVATGPAWHAMPVEAVLDHLGSAESGLDSRTADTRLAEVGYNQLSFTDADPWWKVLLHQFVSPLILILVVAAAITAALQHWADSAAIAFILLLNAAVGYWQEMKAAKEVRALASLSVPTCAVMRDGDTRTISAEELVSGDVVLLSSGDRVPADLRFIAAQKLHVDESMLTGESLPSTKATEPVAEDSGLGDQRCIGFSGTLVTSGRARGVVVATGERTQLGEINKLVQGAGGVTPLERLIHRLEKRIGIVVGIVSAFVFTAGMVMGDGFGASFLQAVALAVAAIPEALPVVLTIAMALGVRHMAKVHAVVRTLPSVETLGSTTIIGSDKTGTLTQNLLTVRQVWTADGMVTLDSHHPSLQVDGVAVHALRAGALTNEARPFSDSPTGFVGDAVDVAMAAAAVRWAAIAPADIAVTPHLDQPYESATRFSQSLRRHDDGGAMLYVKGAPDALLEMSTEMLTATGVGPVDAAAVRAANDQMAAQGLRVLATARAVFTDEDIPQHHLSAPSGLTFLGLEGMDDPPREGVAQAIADCRSAGIGVLMITGDHPATATAIADQLGIASDHALTGADIPSLDDVELRARLHQTGVAARVSPHDKLRIVEVLRDGGDIVAVTGDGVNDAPALKAASIGVAMGKSGTQVAREASDIVLTDDNFVTIVRAVKQGRVTFAAIRKASFFLLSTALAVMIAVAVNSVSDLPLLFLPIQVLWINVVTNGLQDVALAFEPAEGGELRRPPRKPSEGLMSRALWIRITYSAVWMALCLLVMFRWAIDHGYDEDHARTLTLTAFVTLNFFQVMNSRTEFRSLLITNPFGNWLLLIAAAGSLSLHLGAMTWSPSASVLGLVPLTGIEWLWCFTIGASVLVIVEAEKLLRSLLSPEAARVVRGTTATPAS